MRTTIHPSSHLNSESSGFHSSSEKSRGLANELFRSSCSALRCILFSSLACLLASTAAAVTSAACSGVIAANLFFVNLLGFSGARFSSFFDEVSTSVLFVLPVFFSALVDAAAEEVFFGFLTASSLNFF